MPAPERRAAIHRMEFALDLYLKALATRDHEKDTGHLSVEAYRRLNQLRMLLGWVIELQHNHSRMLKHEPMEVYESAMNECELHCETFYYVAFRFLNVLQCLPGLHGCRCKPIADIRHNLIEHAENQTKGIMFNAFSWGSFDDGPVIKPVLGGDPPRTVDRGLYVNLADLSVAVCNAVKRYLGRDVELPNDAEWRDDAASG